MQEDKAKFVQMIGQALHEYASRTEVVKAEYVRDGYEEFAVITFTDDSQINICITADSCLAIMDDIYKALWQFSTAFQQAVKRGEIPD